MSNNTNRYTLISPWGYVGYNLLFSIPVVGLIFLLIYTFSDADLGRRSYARSFWCTLLLAVILLAILAILGGMGMLFAY